MKNREKVEKDTDVEEELVTRLENLRIKFNEESIEILGELARLQRQRRQREHQNCQQKTQREQRTKQ